MDFFKLSTTNVHEVEDILPLHYCSYHVISGQSDDASVWMSIHEALLQLRGKNQICAAEDLEIWVFGRSLDQLDYQLEGLEKFENGLLQDDASVGLEKHSENRVRIQNIFLRAIEGALAFVLATYPSLTHMAPWVWLYNDENDNDEHDSESSNGFLITLQQKFSSTGALYLVPRILQTSLMPLGITDTRSKGDVILAPYGGDAAVAMNDADDTIAGASWSALVSKVLLAEGIELPKDTMWIALRSANFKHVITWPKHLCFVSNQGTGRSLYVRDSTDWRCWFVNVDDKDRFRNPLAKAEDWFRAATDLERSTQELSTIGEEVGNHLSTGSEYGTAGDAQDVDVMTSPPFNQRHTDQQVTMGRIYPTPPDGLVQGSASSHFNSAATPSVMQAEQASASSDVLPTSDDVAFDDPEQKSLLEQDTYQLGAEDLFGDAGGIEIGDAQVDDADFNFFDDGDEDSSSAPAAINIEMPELPAPEEIVYLPGVTQSSNLESHAEAMDVAASELSQRDVEPNQDGSSPGIDDQTQFATQHILNDSELEVSVLHGALHREQPLSPFGIKERLLPPPIPASVAYSDQKDSTGRRRESTFAPIVFQDNLKLGPKYTHIYVQGNENSVSRKEQPMPRITLPPNRKRPDSLKKDPVAVHKHVPASESGDSSFESSASEDESELSSRTPWDRPESKKRKRHADQDLARPLSGSFERMWCAEEEFDSFQITSSAQVTLGALQAVLRPEATSNISKERTLLQNASTLSMSDICAQHCTESMPVMEKTYDVSKEDLICIAQIVGEQAVTALNGISDAITSFAAVTNEGTSYVRRHVHALIDTAISTVLPDSKTWDIEKAAMVRESHPPSRSLTGAGKSQQQPRPLPRTDSMVTGPDYYQIQPSYVKIRRGTENWEMLPTCLSFWETLGLGPTNGAKNVRAFCIFPDNEDLANLVGKFMADIGTVYESCKLGSHVHLRNVSDQGDSDSYRDGMAPVELGEQTSMERVLQGYANTCTELGKTLASIGHHEYDRSVVVYMLNPFPNPKALHHLCACFWLLWKAYRDRLPKTSRRQYNSDVALQIIPISMVASSATMVVPDARYMNMLAREIYDRCPPSLAVQGKEEHATLPIVAAPSVELARIAPKRIGFQLSAEPPNDLLHEGSILHLAYALSRDGQWLSAAWIDSTGHFQASSSFCIRGRSFAEVAEEVWWRVREILAARQVTWRVFIVTHQGLERAVSQCWRSVSRKPRTKPLCVTMLTVQVKAALQLFPPPVESQVVGNGQDSAFFTPVSTPQTGNNFTSSPDVSGQGQPNAPPTPAASDTAATIVENDPEANLVDLTDETFGVLLNPALSGVASGTGIANGALYKRGRAEPPTSSSEHPHHPLPSLGVSVHWTVQIKPDGRSDEGSVKQAELTLKEVLRMYRNLALLTNARGLDAQHAHPSTVPVHVLIAMRSIESLEGFLQPVRPAHS